MCGTFSQAREEDDEEDLMMGLKKKGNSKYWWDNSGQSGTPTSITPKKIEIIPHKKEGGAGGGRRDSFDHESSNMLRVVLEPRGQGEEERRRAHQTPMEPGWPPFWARPAQCARRPRAPQYTVPTLLANNRI